MWWLPTKMKTQLDKLLSMRKSSLLTGILKPRIVFTEATHFLQFQYIRTGNIGPGTRFSKALETFRAGKPFLVNWLYPQRAVHAWIFLYKGNLCSYSALLQLCNPKVFKTSPWRVRKLFRTFQKRAPGPGSTDRAQRYSHTTVPSKLGE